MELKSKYSKIFLGLILYQLSFTIVPLAMAGITNDNNLILVVTAIISILPIIFFMGKENFIAQLKEKREPVSILFLIILILAPSGTNLVGGIFETGIKKLLEIVGFIVPATVEEMSKEIETAPSLFLALYTCVIAPLFEELAFRNGVLRTIEKPRPWIGIVVTGILFALMHTNLDQTIGLIPTAIYFSYLAYRYSMWVPILVHAGNNTIFFLAGYLKSIPSLDQEMVEKGFLVLFFAGITAFIIVMFSVNKFIKKNKSIESKEKPQYLKNPFFWGYVALCIGLIILNDVIL